jgi:hypothetical protein
MLPKFKPDICSRQSPATVTYIKTLQGSSLRIKEIIKKMI